MAEDATVLELRFEEGKRSGEIIAVRESPFLIGRDRSAQLCLDDPAVSRVHLALVLRDGQWVLHDMGGVNPPRVHGRPAISLPLLNGDAIQVGSQTLKVVAGADRPEAVGQRSAMGIGLERPQQLAGAPLWSLLREWTLAIRSLDAIPELLERALEGFFSIIPADRGGIYRLDQESGALVTTTTRNLEGDNPVGAGAPRALYSETIISRAIKAKEARLYSPDTEGEAEAGARPRSMIRKKIRNALCLPLVTGDEEVRGIVYLDQVDEERPPLMPEDLELGSLLASWVAEAMEKAERFRDMDDEIVRLRRREKEQTVLVGESAAIKNVRRRIRKVAKTEVTALITGESGTGKELVARAIHEHSGRADQPFVAINCAAIPDTLLESELFGYAPKSGIQGADPMGKPGRFELAQKGTLVLDEIGELPLSLQAKLLRALEELVIDRLGGREPVPVDVRVVAMTNRDLSVEVEQGRFREDLYYRLHVFPIHIPPLKERPEDILPIASHLLEQMVEKPKKVSISPRAIEMLRHYSWPGNVRELKNILLEALVSGDGRTINPRDLSFQLESGSVSFQSLRDVERNHIRQVLEAVNGNKKKAAELLGIHRSTLYEKIAEYGLTGK